jgi:hypothetical protein
MNTLIAAILALATLGGSAAIAAECTDVAGQATVCQDVSADPATGVNADITADVHPTPPVRAAAECVDAAGQATVCHDITADPATGVNADVTVDVHPTPPVAAGASAAPTCQDLAGQGSACHEVDPAVGVVTVVVTVDPQPPQ